MNLNSRHFIIVRFNSILLSGDTSLSRNRLLSRNRYFGKIGLDNIAFKDLRLFLSDIYKSGLSGTGLAMIGHDMTVTS